MPTTVTWTEEEDARLQDLIKEYGPKRWSLIASKIKSKGSKQCRRRWKNYLIGEIKTGGWSTEEDAALVDAHKEYGNRWTEIAKVVPGRTDNAVKNRWAALCRKDPKLAEDHPESQGAVLVKRRTKRPRAEDGSHETDGSIEDTSGTSDTAGLEYSWDSQGFNIGTIGSPDLSHAGIAQNSTSDTTDMFLQLARELYKIDPTLLLGVQYEQLDSNLRAGGCAPCGSEGAVGGASPTGGQRQQRRNMTSPPDTAQSTSTSFPQHKRVLESPITGFTGPGLIGSLIMDKATSSKDGAAAVALAHRRAMAARARQHAAAAAAGGAGLLPRSASAIEHYPHPHMAVRVPVQGMASHQQQHGARGGPGGGPQRTASLGQLSTSTGGGGAAYCMRPVSTGHGPTATTPTGLQSSHTPMSGGQLSSAAGGGGPQGSAGHAPGGGQQQQHSGSTPSHMGGSGMAVCDFDASPFDCMVAPTGSDDVATPGGGRASMSHCHHDPFGLQLPVDAGCCELDAHGHGHHHGHRHQRQQTATPPLAQSHSDMALHHHQHRHSPDMVLQPRPGSGGGLDPKCEPLDDTCGELEHRHRHHHHHHAVAATLHHTHSAPAMLDDAAGPSGMLMPGDNPLDDGHAAGAGAEMLIKREGGGGCNSHSHHAMTGSDAEAHAAGAAAGLHEDQPQQQRFDSPALGLGSDMDEFFKEYPDFHDEEDASLVHSADQDWYLGGQHVAAALHQHNPHHPHHPIGGSRGATPMVDFGSDFSFLPTM